MQSSSATKTSVIHEDIDSTKFFGGFGNQILNAFLVGDIAGDTDHAKLSGRLGEAAFVFVRDNNTGTFFNAFTRR